MRKASIYVTDFYKNNRLFDITDNVCNRDNCLFHWFLLKEEFRDKNIDLSTNDINKIEESEIAIFNDLPAMKDYAFSKKSNYLVLFESELIRPDNWNVKNHRHFKKVFTWNDDWVDGKKYIKFYWPNKIPENLDFDLSQKSKLCTMVAGHKFRQHPLELYSERERAVRWFEQNHPGDFDLYGIGWDRYCFKDRLAKFKEAWGRFFCFQEGSKRTVPMLPGYPSYKGQVMSKNEMLRKYKFAVCYENVRDIPGYITEKIFDCFFAGCVPVYLGASNVTDFIPQDTFIDKRNFSSYDELYKYIKGMSDEEYTEYLDAIKDYAGSSRISPFSAEYFTQIIINEIAGD